MQARLLAAFAVAIAVVGGAAARGSQATPVANAAGALRQLNAERAANGTPGRIRLNAKWSAACAAHDSYLATNDILAHPEDSSKPGYTTLGNWAGTNAVLAEGTTWTTTTNPFATAPGHLVQMLAPELDVAGVSLDGRYLCMTTWPGFDDASVPARRVYTYPGDGATDVPASERADELPTTPGTGVGIPLGATTGPYLFAYATGMGDSGWNDRVTQASLVGPTGKAVAIRTIDRDTKDVGGGLPPGGAILIPVQPLLAGEPYRASVTISSSAGHTSYSWTFRTAGAPALAGHPAVAVDPPHVLRLELAHTASTVVSQSSFATRPTTTTPAGASAGTQLAIDVGAQAASSGLTFRFAVPNGAVPATVTLFNTAGKTLGAASGITVVNDQARFDGSQLLPGGDSYRFGWSTTAGSAGYVGTFSTTTRALAPGSYRLQLSSGGTTTSATFRLT